LNPSAWRQAFASFEASMICSEAFVLAKALGSALCLSTQSILLRCELLEPAHPGQFTRPLYAALILLSGASYEVHRMLLHVFGQPPKGIQWILREARVSGCPTTTQDHFHVRLVRHRR
jgi:hypothetical protein